MKKLNIKINNKDFKVAPGISILQAARENKIYIPALCGHPDFRPKANCRVCVVETNQSKKLVTACSTEVAEGLEIKTDNARVKRSRDTNLELIYAEHIEKCPSCIWRFECPLLKTAEKYKIKISTFKDRKGNRKTHKFANAVEVIPRTLAENSGLDPIDVLTEMKAAHDKNQKWAGINVFSGKTMDAWKAGVIEPLKIKTQAVSSAAEVAVMILRIDDVIAGQKGSGGPPPGGMPPGMGGMPEY